MKLSEAIRLGSTLRPQVRGAFYRRTWRVVGPVGTCALGAAFEAIGLSEYSPKGGVPAKARKMFSLLKKNAYCPVCGKHGTVERIIVCLNDKHWHDREAIAEWVSSLETKVKTEASHVEDSASR